MFKLERFGLLLLMLPFIASAQVLCFASLPAPKATRLKLIMPVDGSAIAAVRYEKGFKDISLVRIHEAASGASALPAVVSSVFDEVLDGKRTGRYVLTTQGGVVGDLVYVRLKGRKSFTFYEDLEATQGDGCSWEPRFQ